MPHKHKRKRDNTQNGEFNLPPTTKAAPLPTHRPKAVAAPDNDGMPKRSNKRRKPNTSTSTRQSAKVMDDTPKQFARLMAYQNEGKKLRKGLDDGISTKVKDKKKAKAAQQADSKDTVEVTSTIDGSTEALKILPNERLRDFALRVDQSLPLSSVPKHSTKASQIISGVKEKTYLTKHNKRLARMQSKWREDEERLKGKRQGEEEDALEKREEDGMLWMDVDEARNARKGKRAKREGDIWKELEVKRRQDGRGGGNVGGLSAGTAVQAPPTLKRVKNMFKEQGRPASARVGVKS